MEKREFDWRTASEGHTEYHFPRDDFKTVISDTCSSWVIQNFNFTFKFCFQIVTRLVIATGDILEQKMPSWSAESRRSWNHNWFEINDIMQTKKDKNYSIFNFSTFVHSREIGALIKACKLQSIKAVLCVNDEVVIVDCLMIDLWWFLIWRSDILRQTN